MKKFLLGSLFFTATACLEASDEKDGTDSNTDSSTDTSTDTSTDSNYTDTEYYTDDYTETDVEPVVDCYFEIILADEAEDGWNDAYIDFEAHDANGSVVDGWSAISCDPGESAVSYEIGVSDGGYLYWTFHSGSYDEEISYAILDNAGDLLFGDGYPNAIVTPGGFQERTNCQ